MSSTALFTRTGAQGIRQVNVRGLVATAFTHRDSRAGDPDLHTHVAVANKVQTLDGRWLSIDGPGVVQGQCRRLGDLQHRVGAASARQARRAVRGAAGHRPDQAAGPGDRRCRPATEPVLVLLPSPHRGTAGCNWPSSNMIMAAHRRRSKRLHLAHQATLETREAKHEPRSGRRSRTPHRSRHGRRAWTGASQSPGHRPRAAVLASRRPVKRFMIPFGVSIWRSSPS